MLWILRMASRANHTKAKKTACVLCLLIFMLGTQWHMVKGGFITIFLFTYLGVKQYTFSLQIHFSESFVQHYKKDIHFKLVFWGLFSLRYLLLLKIRGNTQNRLYFIARHKRTKHLLYGLREQWFLCSTAVWPLLIWSCINWDWNSITHFYVFPGPIILNH